jgi:hypothetical protein
MVPQFMKKPEIKNLAPLFIYHFLSVKISWTIATVFETGHPDRQRSFPFQHQAERLLETQIKNKN